MKIVMLSLLLNLAGSTAFGHFLYKRFSWLELEGKLVCWDDKAGKAVNYSYCLWENDIRLP